MDGIENGIGKDALLLRLQSYSCIPHGVQPLAYLRVGFAQVA